VGEAVRTATDDVYDRYFKRFDPDLYDPTLWAKPRAKAGMKYFVLRLNITKFLPLGLQTYQLQSHEYAGGLRSLEANGQSVSRTWSSPLLSLVARLHIRIFVSTAFTRNATTPPRQA